MVGLSWYKYLILFIVSFLLFADVNAKDIAFEKITSKDGLSQNDVISIYKDKTGYMWFCTQDGLNRYDGYDFDVFRVSDGVNSISGNLLYGAVEDNAGNLWIATQDKGITVYNTVTGETSFLKNTEYETDILTDNIILDIICDSRNRVIVTTPNGINICRFDNEGSIIVDKFRDIDFIFDDELSKNYGRIIETRNGDYLYCAFSGLYSLETDESGLFTGNVDVVYDNDKYDGYHNIIETENGLLVGAWFDILYFEYADSVGSYIYKSSIDHINNSSFELDHDGNLWTGGTNGLSFFEKSPGSIFPFKLVNSFSAGNTEFDLSNDFVRDIFIDNNKTVWVGTNGGGVNKYDPNKRQFRKYTHTSDEGSVSHNKVFSIYEDSDNNIWIGNEGGGLNLLTADKHKQYSFGFKQYDVNDKDYQNYVYDILEIKSSSERRILVGTSYPSLLVEFVQRNGDWVQQQTNIKANSLVLALLNDSDNNLWVCTYNNGFFKISDYFGRRKVTHYTTTNSGIPSKTIRSVYEDSQKRLWFATADGLMLVDSIQRKSDSLEFTLFKNIEGDNSSLSYNYVVPVLEDSRGHIWIGTYGGGVNVYNEATDSTDSYFSHIGIDEGLLNPVIKDIVEDKNGNMWISTNKGLSCFSYTDSVLRNYGISDGLQDNEFVDRSACLLEDGEILFGGVNGFNAFYPDEITEDTLAPVVVLSRLEIGNTSVETGEEFDGRVVIDKLLNYSEKIKLKYNENSFVIHFSALHFTSPESNQFKYMLKGFDEDWVRTSSSSRFAKYTNLNLGKYTFILNASNCDGVWSESPRELVIVITEPFWRTSIFRVIAISLLIFLLLLYYRTKINIEKRKNSKLESKVYERTLEISNQNEKLLLKNNLLAEQKEEIETNREELEKHKNNLEAIVKERTEELVYALEKAKESDKLKTAFFANLSHEIRTPMNAIVGFSNLLNTVNVSNEDKEKYLNIIDSNTKTLLGIIDTMLDLSLIESNQLRLDKELFCLNDLISSVFSLYEMKHKSDGIQLRLNNTIESSDVKVFSDYTRVSQIITNFMNNALKFTDKGFIELGMKYEGAVIHIYVKDSGMGIPSDKLQYIFKRFAQVEDGLNKNVEGLGLGLAISKKIAKELGGDISVVSEEGSGSVFTFMLSNDNYCN